MIQRPDKCDKIKKNGKGRDEGEEEEEGEKENSHNNFPSRCHILINDPSLIPFF